VNCLGILAFSLLPHDERTKTASTASKMNFDLSIGIGGFRL
jgi:hypothetical protein